MEADPMVHIAQLSGLLAVVLLLSGCALLHLRLRRRSSLSLLISLVMLAAWTLGGQALLFDTLVDVLTVPAGNDIDTLIKLGSAQSVVLAVESALMLWLGLSFFLAVRTIRSAG